MTTDPRTPLIIGISALGVLIVAGIVWAVFFIPEDSSRYDYNASFSEENDPTWGPSDAKVVVHAYEDFQCPACKSAEPGVQHLQSEYGDRVHFVWNDYPLTSIHHNAERAANAARCAEAQGKFWEYHDFLYEFQSNWSNGNPDEELIRLAQKAELNQTAFEICLEDEPFKSKVTNDMSEGRANRVDSTPTFFINNKRVVGVLTPADWDREIQAALGSAGSAE